MENSTLRCTHTQVDYIFMHMCFAKDKNELNTIFTLHVNCSIFICCCWCCCFWTETIEVPNTNIFISNHIETLACSCYTRSSTNIYTQKHSIDSSVSQVNRDFTSTLARISFFRFECIANILAM